MTTDLGRRRLLVSTTALAGVYLLPTWAAAATDIPALPADGEAFDFDRVIAHARALAQRPYTAPEQRYDKLLDEIGYEAFMGIHTRKQAALWAASDTPVTVEFFHLDQNARSPVAIHVVENGRTRRIPYDSALFRYDDPKLAERLPADLGFSGLRVLGRTEPAHEWLAFKGASYFRSPGGLDQYGLSARGVAVDTGYGSDEAFPNFTQYWLIKPAADATRMTLCALLEGEHVTGAYRITLSRPNDIVLDIESRLFQRRAIRRLGIAPLTSMFWFSETNARRGVDWRPEIHDSDGLAMTTGQGERLWRALVNPPRTQYSVFEDKNPKGFGLLQRDRVFDHYQDPDVGFENRPSLWVEPRGDWGSGHVGLLELPTDEEVYDNINVFWVPSEKATAARAWRFDYRLYWGADQPDPPALARVMATRTGRAGAPGTYQDQSVLARKFVIDFAGKPLDGLDADNAPEPRVHASHGQIDNPYVQHVEQSGRWRVFFDWKGELPPDDTPVELQAALYHGARQVTETWLYAYYPEALPRQLYSGDDNA
ncbi:glucan biosynthesis protein D [Salinisphaera sp. S4-8]|uniref:glucan biosynthesis protein n=1 Tax=Salinisphaera sp. S4-8 TaxID=633357 RepID=UPI00333E1CC7